MARRAGTADLPLHGGHIPKWLADRMTRPGRERRLDVIELCRVMGADPYRLLRELNARP
jgi:hypothetical protein